MPDSEVIKKKVEKMLVIKEKAEKLIGEIKERQKELSLITLIYDSGRDDDACNNLTSAITLLKYAQQYTKIDDPNFQLYENLINDFEKLAQESKKVLRGYTEDPYSTLFMKSFIKQSKNTDGSKAGGTGAGH